MASIDMQTNVLLKESIHFFTHEEATINLDPPQIIIGPLVEKRILAENDFYSF